jgi:chromosome segregation ATPase
MDEDSQRGGRRPSIGRFVADSVGDLGSAVNFLRVLPDIATDLRAIHEHTANMDREVTGMHAAVERLDVQMSALREKIGDLENRMAAVEGAVARLEPHVADVNLAMRPLRRVRARLPRRRAGEAPAES